MFFGTHAHLLGQLGMNLQMPLLAVDRNEELGTGQGVNNFQFLLAGVARDMKALRLLVDHLGPLPVKLVDDLGNGVFVAGDGGGGDDDAVARLDLDLPVRGERHAVQRGHILTLRAGGHNDQLVLG